MLCVTVRVGNSETRKATKIMKITTEQKKIIKESVAAFMQNRKAVWFYCRFSREGLYREGLYREGLYQIIQCAHENYSADPYNDMQFNRP
jgi:aminopeptidase C